MPSTAGVSQEQGLTPKNLTLMVLPWQSNPGDLHSCLEQQPSTPAWNSSHPSPRGKAQTGSALQPPTQNSTPRLWSHLSHLLSSPARPGRGSWGAAGTWGSCWPQTISEEHSGQSQPLHSPWTSLAPTASGQEETGQEVGQPLLAPLLLNCPKNWILQKPKP